MNSRITVALCMIVMFLLAVALPMATAEQNIEVRPRKLAKTAWLSAPHFAALNKRGRFVFRDLVNGHHDLSNDDADLSHDKRNWRL